MKQLGIAMQAYHDAVLNFPPGCMTDAPPYNAAGGGWGSSWMVFLLPYIEQNALFQKWDFKNGNSGYTNSTNRALTSGVVLKTYRCPSSPLPLFSPTPTVMQANYVGISGAKNGLIPNYSETRVNTAAGATGCCSGGGDAAAGGVLFAGSAVRIGDISDGTTSTMIISEHGNWITDTAGKRNQWTGGGLYGWTMGTNVNTWNGSPDNRFHNCITIRYAINQTTGWAPGGNCQVGVCPDNGNNTPLNSTHTGGVVAVFADGHVQFLSNATTLAVQAQLATRDDGQVTPNF